MLIDFSDRHPLLFGVMTVILMLIVPGLVMCVAYILPIDNFPTSHIIVALAFVLQMFLCFTAERMILLIIPFVVTLFGVLSCEGIYLASIVSAQSGTMTSARLGNMLLSYGVAVFGPEFVGIVVAFVAYAIIAVIRNFRR